MVGERFGASVAKLLTRNCMPGGEGKIKYRCYENGVRTKGEWSGLQALQCSKAAKGHM
jgi:hypothetical protein